MNSCRTELYYQYRTSLNFWGSFYIIHTSFKINSEAALGSPVSLIVTNLYMEHFEREAHQSASNPLSIGSGLWMTLLSFNNRPKTSIPGPYHRINPEIKLTLEGNQGNGAIPFLDTLVTPEADNSLSNTVYHKPTHTH